MTDPLPISLLFERSSCQHCGSRQVVERRDFVNKTFVKLYLHCKMCRRDVFYWTGSVSEERKFKAKRRYFLRKMTTAARSTRGRRE